MLSWDRKIRNLSGSYRINKKNPLSRGLVFCANGLLDLSTGIVGKPIESFASNRSGIRAGRWGRSYRVNSTTNAYGGFVFSNVPCIQNRIVGRTDITMAWLGNPAAQYVDVGYLLTIPYYAATTSSAPFTVSALRRHTTSTQMRYHFPLTSSTHDSRYSPAGGWLENRENIYGVAKSLSNLRFFKNQIIDTQSAVTTTLISQAGASTILLGNGSLVSNAGTGLESEYSMACLWDRALSDDEWLSFSADPFQILGPSKSRVYFNRSTEIDGTFEFDRVVIFGASILASIGNAPWAQYLSNEYDLDVAVTNAGVGGNTAVDGADRVDSVVAAVPEGETAVFICHFGGNGLQQIFQDLSTARADYIAAMTYIYNAITSAGHICFFCNISFRQFGTPTGSAGDWTGGNSYDDPALYGSDFVNEEVLHPLLGSLNPALLNSDGRSVFDFHNYSYNSGPLLISDDGIHWLESVAPQRWMCDVLYSLSTTGQTPVIPRVDDPRTREYFPDKIHINFLNPPSGPDCYIRGLNNMPINPLRLVLLDTENDISGLVLNLVNVAPGATGSNGIGDGSDRQLDFMAGAQTASYHRADAGGSRTYTISGFRPGAVVDFRAASSRASNNATWLTRVSLNGVSLGEKNTGSTTIINTFEGEAVIGESGTLAILLDCPSGFAYLNSAELDISYPDELLVDDVAIESSMSSPALAVQDVLAVGSIVCGLSVSSPSLAQPSSLSVAAMDISVSVGSLALQQANVVVLGGLSVSVSAGVPELIQAGVLSVGDALSSVSMDSISPSMGDLLAVNGATLSVAVGGVLLVQANLLAADDMSISSDIDAAVLVVDSVLSVADLASSVSFDSVVLDHSSFLAVSGIDVDLSADSPLLSQQGALSVGGAGLSILMDSITIGGGVFVSETALGIVIRDFNYVLLVEA